jgi:hypothetical protein
MAADTRYHVGEVGLGFDAVEPARAYDGVECGARAPPASEPLNSQFLRLCGALHNRKNWLFVGSDSGGERAALFYTLIRTATLNSVEPEAYLREVIARIGAHPVNRLHELLPWNIAAPATHSVAS